MAEPPLVTDGDAATVAAPVVRPGASPSAAEDAPPLVAGRYEILGMLGSGGMGTVYRARDRELDETVALKLLRKELAASPGMLERFRREVKLARRVTHKNVARTFDIGEDGGERFLTMELIEGEMLGSHLASRGRVSLREVVRIGRDVCAGLAAAHAAGVLHRDLKPENVIIARDGRAVITDFGIARAVSQGELGRTGGGMVGTPAYMAPEQVEGSSELDGRVDLYALGTMLYELVSGRTAWGGDSVIAVAAGRLLRPPPDVRSVAPDVSEDAAALILKLMARKPEDRYGSAEEAGEALAMLESAIAPSARSLLPPGSAPKTVTAASLQTARKTVAVLPLLNLGPADDEYLAQTLDEDLVDLLSVVPSLRVRPRGETSRFDQRTRDVREAGRTLDVDVVVDGSLRRTDEGIRVSVRLVTVEDGFQLWARRFDCPATRVLAIAEDAASAIAHALTTELTAEALPMVGDAQAQELYLRGRYLLRRGSFEVSRQAIALLGEAHRRAPDDPRIAGTYALSLARFSTEPANVKALEEGREIAERTLERHPTVSEARVALGSVHLNSGEALAAAVQMKRALALNPNAVEALDSVGRMLIEVNRWKLGIATLERVLGIDPLMSMSRDAIGRARALLGDYEGALESTAKSPDDVSEQRRRLLLRARIALWRRDPKEATALLDNVEPLYLPPPIKRSLIAALRIAAGGVLDDEIRRDFAALPLEQRHSHRRIAFMAQLRTEIKLAAREVDLAFVDLRIASDAGLIDLMWLERCPAFDEVRTRPEFIAVHASTLIRATRVIEILEPGAVPYTS